jgi:CheY-like chemotaxis protein
VLILCVDDEPDSLTILRLFLSAHGFEITVASSAAEALCLVESRRPDLIITDYAMPAMSGLDLCRALRGQVASRDIPIILHSGVELRGEHPDLFDRVLLKPAELDLLAREIRSLLPAAGAQKSA